MSPPPPDSSDDATPDSPPEEPVSRLAQIARAARRAGEAEREAVGDEPQALVRGIKAFMAGEYALAHRLVLPFAEQGHRRAQQILAKMYFAGNGVEQDLEQYEHWLRRAAEGGDKTAKAKLKRLARARAQRPPGEGPSEG